MAVTQTGLVLVMHIPSGKSVSRSKQTLLNGKAFLTRSMISSLHIIPLCFPAAWRRSLRLIKDVDCPYSVICARWMSLVSCAHRRLRKKVIFPGRGIELRWFIPGLLAVAVYNVPVMIELIFIVKQCRSQFVYFTWPQTFPHKGRNIK
jgi:hypothetical protein